MSQATLLPSSPVAPSFPPLVYHGVPVLTTEMLAQAYEVEAKQIRQNFANNRERFIEGKHFFQLSGNDLREFKNYVENFDLVQIDKRARHFTLWTERGAARNAKMLNSDRAWDVFELLEETFFRVVRKESESHPLADDMVLPASPDRPSRRTDPERKQLTAIINTWVSMAPIHYASARAQVNAHFGVASVDALSVAQVREAIAWVQAKIDALPPVPELPAAEKLPLFRNGCFYSPGVNKNHVPGPREAALMDLWQTWGQQTAGLEKEFTGMMRELERRRGDLFAVAVSDLGRNADTAFSFESLMEGLFYTHNMALHYFKEAISLQRLSIRLSVNVAVALGR